MSKPLSRQKSLTSAFLFSFARSPLHRFGPPIFPDPECPRAIRPLAFPCPEARTTLFQHPPEETDGPVMDTRDLAFPGSGHVQYFDFVLPEPITHGFRVAARARSTKRKGFRSLRASLTVRAVPPVGGPQVRIRVPVSRTFLAVRGGYLGDGISRKGYHSGIAPFSARRPLGIHPPQGIPVPGPRPGRPGLHRFDRRR